MCDTFVALPSVTASGNLIFGKNSDREPNEAQAIIRILAKEHTEKHLQCTYIEVPQVAHTHEIILSKPFQMWGAEMGINEYGVVIGNEAVFTKIKFTKKNQGLTGMDLLRLALERCRTAISALETITELLAEYGQDACGGYQNQHFFYHNSFIIADTQEAWVLETAGNEWLAQKVKGFRSISNGLTIENEFDLQSKNVIDLAYKKGWLKKGEDFNFAKAYSNNFMTYMSSCKTRQAHTQNTGNQSFNQFSIQEAFDILSSHYLPNEEFAPSLADSRSVCMHATGLLNPSQTTSSMVVENRPHQASTIWLTGTSSPCLSVYKPFFLGGKSILKNHFKEPVYHLDESMWWQAEVLHRLVSKDYQAGKSIFNEERQTMQVDFWQKEAELIQKNQAIHKLDIFSEECLIEYLEKIKDWTKRVQALKLKQKSWNPLYHYFIQQQNKKVGI